MARMPFASRPLRSRRDHRERVLENASMLEHVVSVAGLVGRSVRLANGDEVGRLRDLVARWQGEAYPALTGVVARVGRRRVFVPMSHVGDVRRAEVVLGSASLDLRDFERRDGEVLLAGDVLDRQLVDCDGVRVVRASDLYLARVASAWHLVGVDVGFQSLLRRLGPARWRTRPTPDRVVDWAAVQPFGVVPGALRLRGAGDNLARLRPAELADLLEELGRTERRELLGALEAGSAADVLEEMEPEPLRQLLRDLPGEEAAALVAEMEPDEAVDALRDVDEDEREALLASMPPALAVRLRSLLRYPADTAGGLMTTQVVIVHADDTVDEVRERLRRDGELGGALDAVVLVDADGRFDDDVRIVELFTAPDATPVGRLARPDERIAVPVTAGVGEVIDRLIDSRRASLTVVGEDGVPVGRILADDVIDVLVSDRGRHRVHLRLP